jgi:hypothetical protein
MNHLVPCPECSRHVRVSATECPFCALPLDLAATPEPRLPNVRLSRAATLAFGATLASATALAACGGATDAPVPVYGAPAGGAAGMSAAGAAGTEGGGGPIPVYGAPAGGMDGTGTAGSGQGPGAGGGPVPVYGAAP